MKLNKAGFCYLLCAFCFLKKSIHTCVSKDVSLLNTLLSVNPLIKSIDPIFINKLVPKFTLFLFFQEVSFKFHFTTFLTNLSLSIRLFSFLLCLRPFIHFTMFPFLPYDFIGCQQIFLFEKQLSTYTSLIDSLPTYKTLYILFC